MKTVMNKTLLAVALATSFGIASTNAMAVAFPDFTVDESSVFGTSPLGTTFSADKITGNYVEVASFSGINNFAVSIKWNAGQFVSIDGTTPIITSLLNNSIAPYGYGLYALYQGSGTYVPNPITGGATFTFDPGLGSLGLYIDPTQDTTFVAPGSGFNPWTTGLDGDDYLIATGVTQSGTATLDPSLPTCSGGGINCGSFGTTTSFALTGLPQNPNGKQYFTIPDPFYNLSFQSGQFNNFTVGGPTQTINGSLDVVFGNSVPEPATLALLGLGLIGMGAAARRRKAA